MAALVRLVLTTSKQILINKVQTAAWRKTFTMWNPNGSRSWIIAFNLEKDKYKIEYNVIKQFPLILWFKNLRLGSLWNVYISIARMKSVLDLHYVGNELK